MMEFRRARNNDIEQIEQLLMQVLNIHAEGRPDIFIPDTVKYTAAQLAIMIQDDQKPIFVAADDHDQILGYAFCILEDYSGSNNRTPIRTLFIDDLCVEQNRRGMHVGSFLIEQVKAYAASISCYNVTLNVWSFNSSAQKFYEKQGLKPMETTLECILK